MKNTLIAILVIVILVLGYLFIKEKTKPTDYSNAWPETEPATSTNNNSQTNTNSNQGTTTPVSGLKLFTRASYSFKAPASWKETGPSDIGGCAWDGVANDTNDGMRQAGEIGIYPKSCFNLAYANYTEMTEKDGFYILAIYSRDNGTTSAEEIETKAVYQTIVGSFQVNPATSAINNSYYESGDDINGTHVGYVKTTRYSEGSYSLRIDYVLLGNCPPVNPGDQCVINNNTLIRTFPISNNAFIQVFDLHSQPVSTSLQDFSNTINASSGNSLYRVTIEGGVIIKIDPVYLP